MTSGQRRAISDRLRWPNPATSGLGMPTTVQTRIWSSVRRTLTALALPLHRGGGTGKGLLPIDAPIAQFLEWDRLTGDGATHEGPRTDDPIFAVNKFNFRFACVDRTPLKSVHRATFPIGLLYATIATIRKPGLGRGRSCAALWTKNSLSGKGRATPRHSLQASECDCGSRQSSLLLRLRLKQQDSPCRYSFATTTSIRPLRP